jgi:chromosome segregation ATPase
MTMHDPQSEERAGSQDVVHWLQDQVGQIRAQLGRTQQQGDQIQAAILDVNEKLRDADGRLRELSAKTVGVPVMQDQMRQVSGLLERIQDAEVLIDTKFEMIERTHSEERHRGQSETNDLYRRLQDLERLSEAVAERQATIDDSNRRFQDDVSRTHLQHQALLQRMETVESKSVRSVDAVTRMEQAYSEIESALRALRREDDVLAERARIAHDVASRVETEMQAQVEEYRTLHLLVERVELLRAERQRLEDRTSRVEESLEDTRLRIERQEDVANQVEARLKSHDGRIEHVHTSTLDYRRSLSDQLLKLNQMIERMKRRQVEELERQVKELRVQSSQLKNEED